MIRMVLRMDVCTFPLRAQRSGTRFAGLVYSPAHQGPAVRKGPHPCPKHIQLIGILCSLRPADSALHAGGRYSWCSVGIVTRDGDAKENRVRPPVLSERAAVQVGGLSTAARSLECERVFRAYPATPLFIVPSPHHESATFY